MLPAEADRQKFHLKFIEDELQKLANYEPKKKADIDRKNEKLNLLIDYRQEVAAGNYGKFEYVYAEHAARVNKELMEKYGNQHKYKGGDAKLFVQNHLFQWKSKMEKEVRDFSYRTVSDGSKLLSKAKESVETYYGSVILAMSVERKKRDHAKQEISEQFRYEALPIWSKDIENIYHNRIDEADLILHSALDDFKADEENNRRKVGVIENDFKTRHIADFCKHQHEQLALFLEGKPSKDDIKEYIHSVEDEAQTQENHILGRLEMEESLYLDEVVELCDLRKDDFHKRQTELHETYKKALENIQIKHRDAAGVKHNERNRGPEKK